MKYISALDRNQIPSCGIDLIPFKQISADDVFPKPDEFKKYDDELYFHDHGIIGDKRFIVGFNPALFAEDRKNRKEKIRFFEAYLKNENKDLKNAQRNRKRQASEGRVLNEGQTYSAYPLEGSPHPIIFSTFSTIESQCSFEYLLDNSVNIIYHQSLNIAFIDLVTIWPFYIS